MRQMEGAAAEPAIFTLLFIDSRDGLSVQWFKGVKGEILPSADAPGRLLIEHVLQRYRRARDTTNFMAQGRGPDDLLDPQANFAA